MEQSNDATVTYLRGFKDSAIFHASLVVFFKELNSLFKLNGEAFLGATKAPRPSPYIPASRPRSRGSKNVSVSSILNDDPINVMPKENKR